MILCFRARQTLCGRRLPSEVSEGVFSLRKGGICMVTWEELIALLGLLVAIAEFVFFVCKHIFETKKK